MKMQGVEGVLRVAEQNGDLVLQAACWRTMTGVVPYALWVRLSGSQRAAVSHSSVELTHLSSVEVLALSVLEASSSSFVPELDLGLDADP